MSLISKDFRFREPEYDEPRHSKLRWSLFIVACAAIGGVIANTVDIAKTDSSSDGLQDNGMASTQLLLNPKSDRQTTQLPSFVGKRSIATNSIDDSTENTSASTESKAINHKIIEKEPSQPAPAFVKVQASTPSNNDTRKNFSLNLPKPQAKQESIEPNIELSNVEASNTGPANIETSNIKPDNTASLNKWREFEVKSGDSLARLFSRANIKAQQLDELMKSGDAVKTLRKIFPKDIIRVQTDDSGNLNALSYDINKRSYLMVERRNGRLIAQTHEYQIDTLSAHASGTIESSLFLAAKKAGISQNIIMELASIFGWDIDFALDIRKGDKFTVVYEENYHNGEKVSDGNILAAEFINKGKTYRAVRYTNPQTNNSAYFTADGKSMRKAFLRTPVDFSRISSRFTINRYHPILHKFRSHKGVDYAAKRGTPIRAAGDGKVIFKGRKGGYGRVVILQHGTKYTTLYAHLNSYNKKIKKGSKVSQGQIIAYVGSSGLATGPHLHYEFRVNGVHRNPLTVKLPESKPVPKRYLADFELMTKPAIAYLDSVVRNKEQVALADSTNDSAN